MPALHASLQEVAAVSGLSLLSHLSFQAYEPQSTHFCVAYLVAWGAWTAQNVLTNNVPLTAALANTFILASVYNVVTLSSIAVYRLFFHRARKFKGPASLALSKWALVPSDLIGKRPERMDKLHAQYGDVVRIGPREISINDVTALSAVLGASSTMVKGPWYKAAHGGAGPRSLSLHTTIDPSARRSRRRIWDAGFSIKSLQSYEEQVRQITSDIMNQFHQRARSGSPIAIDEWAMFYSFDVMGQIGFSKSFDHVANGSFSKPIQLLEEAMQAIMVLGCVPWMAPLLRLLPSPVTAFENWTEQALIERKEHGASKPDIFSHLLGEDKESGWVHTWLELKADSGLVVVAGSDTSSTTLSMTLYLLLTHPEALATLREEVDALDSLDDFNRLGKDCPYLNACINEAMRLFPPVASGVQRETLSEPAVIPLRDGSKIVVPPHTVVSLPTRSLHRDPRNFSQPDAFRPERWLNPSKEQVFNKNAFIPFGYGPSGCVGKGLAWMEMRIFLANFVRSFDFAFDKSFNEEAFLAGIKDTFTMTRTKHITVTLSERNK